MLFANVAREKITPPLGTFLFGYKPGITADSINDDIRVTALLLSDGQKRVLLINAELCLITNELNELIRSKVAEATGVDASCVIVSATHTHSAPNVSGIKGWGEIDFEYVDKILLPCTLAAAVRACEKPQRVRLGVGVTQSLVGINRREITRDSEILLGQNPWGPFDPRMTLISLICAGSGEQLVNIVHYGCHGTAAGCNHEVTRDWSGVMLDRLEREYGGMAVFFNGAEGDVGPRLSNGRTTGDISYVRELGEVAALDALRARASVTKYDDDTGLSVLTDRISIPYKSLPPEKELIMQLDAILARNPEPQKLDNMRYLEYSHTLDLLELYRQKKKPERELSFAQTVFALGDIAFVPFPFEMFSEITMRLAHYSPYARTLGLSNTNGSNAYLPVKEELCRGGYEVKSFIFGNACGLIEDADTVIINQNLNLLEKLYKA